MFSSFLASSLGEKLGHTKGPQDKKNIVFTKSILLKNSFTVFKT